MKSLLKGAKQSIKKSEAFTKFVKRGNMDSAWKDFQSLNPTDVRKKKLGGGVSQC